MASTTFTDGASVIYSSWLNDVNTATYTTVPAFGTSITALTSTVQNSSSQVLSSVAGTNTITGTLTPALTAYAVGQTFRFVSAGANTGAVTININGRGAKAITKNGTSPLTGGEIASGAAVQITYDGTQFQLVAGASSGYAASGANSDITSLSGITGAISGPTSITGAAAGMPLSNVTSLNSGQVAGLRNRIINGRFDVWQRGTSMSSGVATYTYTADRFCVFAIGAQVVVGKVTGIVPTVAGVAGINGINIAGAASNTYVDLTQRIEASEVNAGLRGTITLSAWVYQTTGASMTPLMIFGCPTATDNYAAANQYGGGNTQVVPNATWTRISFTVDTSGYADIAKGLYVSIRFPTLTTGNVYCSLVQLELGSVATPFEQRPYGLELALCQRYYETGQAAYGVNYSASTGAVRTHTFFTVAKRATPSPVAVTTGTVDQIFTNSFSCYQSTASGAAYNPGTFTALAEL